MLMGTKNSPGKFDCYAKASDDEPLFVLLARDRSAPAIVRAWAEAFRHQCERDNPSTEMTSAEAEKYDEALDCANAMEAWRKKNR
jgi:hypothetical protein